jgi:hydrogenase large subunit
MNDPIAPTQVAQADAGKTTPSPQDPHASPAPGKRIVVDPITRIEGHLRIEAETGPDGSITRAHSSGTMVRGLEIVLRGRDPRDAWAFAQRICGVCTLVHGLASVRAVEDALDYPIPPNATLIRNLMSAQQWLHDHVMHFYHLHALDWVDVVSALKADAKQTSALAQSISPYARSSPGYFTDVQKRVAKFVESGQLGIFANGYWGHPAYKLPPEANLMALAHYLDALQWQREICKLQTIFGGRNPHPNFLVGGMPSAISVQTSDASGAASFRGGEAATAVNVLGLRQVADLVELMRQFVHEVYVPDVLAIAGFYKDWFRIGEGVGNFLCYGDFPANGKTLKDVDSFFLPRGVVMGRDLNTVHPVDLYAEGEIEEYVAHSWYEYSEGKNRGLHPHKGETKLAYTGPKPPYQYLDVDKSYSWIKSPRWKGKPMEVGPLARLAVLYASGHAPTRETVDRTLKQLDLPMTALYSTMGRTAARALESRLMVDQMQGWFDQLMANIRAGDVKTHNQSKWDPSTWPREAKGAGFMEAPRGGLCHFVVIRDGKIANYQAVVPTTWNAGPRDAQGNEGPYEASLRGTPLADPAKPLEILRTVHSFDPCLACAVHVAGPRGEGSVLMQVR